MALIKSRGALYIADFIGEIQLRNRIGDGIRPMQPGIYTEVAGKPGSRGGAMVETSPSPKVMVIDDERLIADTLAEILNQNGYDAAPVYSGEEALDRLPRFAPDIVLSDVRMSNLDGIQTAERIHNLDPTCRVILFSASAISEDEKARIDECGFEFLQRPLHPTDILDQLQGRTAFNVIPFPTTQVR